MDAGVIIALATSVTAIVTAVVAPPIILIFQNRGKRQEKEIDAKIATEAKLHDEQRADAIRREDLRRQDEVAEKVARNTALVLEANRRVEKSTEVLNGKVDVVHTIVNSAHTEVLKALLVSLRAQLGLTLQLHNKGGSGGGEAAQAALESQIEQLVLILKQRQDADDTVKRQLDAQAKSPLSRPEEGRGPVSVEDDRTATAGERVADAMERTADATERATNASVKR